MEEIISIERPRPFSSGYIIPFYTHTSGAPGAPNSNPKTKKPFELTVQTSSVEYLKNLRRLAVYIPAADEMARLEAFAKEMLVQKNKQWFKNALSDEAVRAMYQRSVNADGYMMLRFSPDHLPKDVFVNDRAVTEWDRLESQWLQKKDGVIEMVSVELMCHGIYLKKQTAELLWKIQRLYVYTSEPRGIQQLTDVDEHKADIEAYWENEVNGYNTRLADEIQQLRDKIRLREEKQRRLAERLNACKSYSTKNPEWNKTMESIQHEISQKNYFI